MKVKYLLLFLICVQSLAVKAGGPSMHFGATAQGAIKAGLFSNTGSTYSVWGKGGLSLCTHIEGEHEMALSFVGKVGIFFDAWQYKVFEGCTFGLENNSIVFQPEILIPTRYPKLKISAGFALDCKIGSNMFVRTSSDQPGTLSFDFDKIDSVIQRHEREIVPMITLGMVYEIRDRIWLQAFVHQAMVNALPGDPAVSIINNTSDNELKLHHQPTYFGLCLWYFFN